MPRKSSKNENLSNAKEIKWGGFIDIRLDEDQKAAFRVWALDNEETVWTDFAEIVSGGFKYGLSYDSENDCWIATFTASGENLMGLRDRYCLTARAPAWQTALALLVYKHVEIAHGNWGEYRPVTHRMDNFG